METNTILNTSALIGSGTRRQLIATVLSDGQRHSVASLMRRTGSSWDGLRGRLSELRTRNGFVIDHSEGFVQFRGIQV